MNDIDRTIPPERATETLDYEELTLPGKRDRKPDGRFNVGELVMRRYKVLAELGQGGMGVVYKCFDETAGIEVALKALPPELSHNTLEMEDIRDNFQLVSKLVHQNIAISKNLEKDPANGNYYLIMECVEGEDLRRWLRRKRKEGELTLDDILPIVKQVADALDYAHKQKIIHRDIKPGNIMINAAGEIKVLDFGLAAQIHTSMTRVSMAYHGTSGTGPYMAPEQWRGRAQGAAADQYALAVMTYEMLAGHLPFESTDPAVLQQAVLTQEAEELTGFPSSVKRAVARAMNKEPENRFESCSEFVDALCGKKSSGDASSSKWIWSVVAVIFLIGAVGVLFYLSDSKVPAEQVKVVEKTPDVPVEQAKIAEKAPEVPDKQVKVVEKTPDVPVEQAKIAEKAPEVPDKQVKIVEKAPDVPVKQVRVVKKAPAKKVENKKFPEMIQLSDDIRLEMVHVKAGSFIMGSPENESGRLSTEKQHKVTLTKDFYIGKFEVTFAQYNAVMGKDKKSSSGNDKDPVNEVDWNKAKDFCRKLNERFSNELPHGYKFDLPTEAQWEYACRAGTTTPFNYGSTFKRDNAWGIYDMHSGAAEWCNDRFGAYPGGEVIDPAGGDDAYNRIVRGGNSNGDHIKNEDKRRSAYRTGSRYDTEVPHIGFRLALVPDTTKLQSKNNNAFSIKVETDRADNVFYEGDTLTLNVKANKDCYIIVYVQQSDGSQVVLFPNFYNRNNKISADIPVEIPGSNKPGFRINITPPFGKDKIFVLASTQMNNMFSQVSGKAQGNKNGFWQTKGLQIVSDPLKNETPAIAEFTMVDIEIETRSGKKI